MRRALLLAALMGATAWADTSTFNVNDPASRDTMTWDARAHGETIHGHTTRVRGTMSGNPHNIEDSPHIVLQADLDSMSSDNRSRDSTMKGSDCLDTAHYPTVRWTLKRILDTSARDLSSGQPVTLHAVGDLTLHGVTRETPVEATLVWERHLDPARPGLGPNLLHLKGRLDIKLTDFNIRPPQILFVKLEDPIRIDLDVYGSTALPAP